MPKYDLSVLIPARNEVYLSKTVEDILANKRGKTEIIVALDGEWANPALPDHEDLTIIYFPESIGQRAATNQAARLSEAKYVMKIDSHCTVDEGFDVKLMADMRDDWTVIPAMYNLHAFDWVCIGKTQRCGKYYVEDESIKKLGCGYSKYQGPTPEHCPECKGNMERLLIWKIREHKRSEFYRFDRDLHFQYWSDFKRRPEAQGDIAPSFSAQGSCFMLTREKYWELDICDENHGSWGQQGTEVACKTWLSGGQLMINKKTWYSHLFRTQGGDFGFPYVLSGSDIDKARSYSRNLWIGNSWPKAKHDLNWLLEKFKPVPDWHDKNEKSTVQGVNTGNTDRSFVKWSSKGIIFYTDNQLTLKIAHKVQKRLKEIGLPIVSASLKPMNFGENIVVKGQRGILTYFRQIVAALEASTAEYVFFCEHDVLYSPSHFDFTPPTKDKFYYNLNVWRWKYPTDLVVRWDANQVAELCCSRELALQWYREKLKQVEDGKFNKSYEPGGRDKSLFENWRSAEPNIDIRHGANLTKSKWSIKDFRDKSTCVNWEESTVDKIPGFFNSL